MPNSSTTESSTLNYVGREIEKEQFHSFFEQCINSKRGGAIIISGDSGTGKSEFLKTSLHEVNLKKENLLSLYIDISNDEYRSSKLFSSFLELSLLPYESTPAYPVQVNSNYIFHKFKTEVLSKNSSRVNLLNKLAKVLGAAILAKGVVDSIIEESELDEAEEFEKYLSWISKEATICIAIDNYQFLNLETRNLVERIIFNFPESIIFIVVDRTNNRVSELVHPVRVFNKNRENIVFDYLTERETFYLIRENLSCDATKLDEISSDVFIKTKGNLKEIEYCLIKIKNLLRTNQELAIESFIATLDKLPVIHRKFLTLVSLMDGGIKTELAKSIIYKSLGAISYSDIDESLLDLLNNRYLMLNTSSHDRLRAGHESVISAIKTLSDGDLLESVRSSAIEVFAASLTNNQIEEEHAYLLHCIVGLQNFNEISSNLEPLTQLIESQHRQNQYHYISAIVEPLSKLIICLGDEVIKLILDSMQKSSEFSKGLEIVNTLSKESSERKEYLLIYKYKYLVQKYQYDEASNVAEQLQEDDWKTLYKLNLLMAQNKSEEARIVFEEHNFSNVLSEADSIIYRNTILLFEKGKALSNINKAKKRLKDVYSPYLESTMLNNEGLIYLRDGNVQDAACLFSKAESLMKVSRSRERFQSLLNLGVTSALSKNYKAAIEYTNESYDEVPSSLLLDRVKIKNNHIIYQLISNTIKPFQALEQYAQLKERVTGVEMPYVIEALNSNIDSIKHGYTDKESLLDYYLYHPVLFKEATLYIMTSIHWRY
ncbi:tetratricopeptide repeat protein [Pseudoalteromonas luteoviolacea]|uniref:Uncharacterized protein n=1 Tax=Pseudoalteromonas luteoviolacea S4060-1 TaxID=1365257 RepID=A0A167JFZ7_9GAMM|nr:hypothetical protein [Pseudoalteromonas luteoviolacea]KZN61038.1 hypothetical protein N478_25845 [Pseudoalteromonas luteoviolacea S4060-1]